MRTVYVHVLTNNILDMTPHSKEATSQRNISQEMSTPTSEHKWEILPSLMLIASIVHIGLVTGVYLIATGSVMWQTILFAIFLDAASLIGVTAGAHRLWAHRAYKAKLPLKIFLAFIFSIASQHSIFNWAKDHRMHHKYSETDADPHNAKRGFFFSHYGWLLVEKHPEFIKKEKQIDVSDLLADPVVRIQRKYSVPIIAFSYMILPTVVPVVLWGETLLNSLFVACFMRHALALHQVCLINSVAHMWGNRPYDRHINPVENYWVTCLIYGEGFHNYHHTFPWDYSASELGWHFNLSTAFINLMAWIGQAYDLKRATPETILKRKMKTGENYTHLISAAVEE